jgi:Phosphopantetheine attachment site
VSRPADIQPESRAAAKDSQTGIDELTGEIVEVFRRRTDSMSLGPDDDFFQHGGSSFLAAQCTADLRKKGLVLSIQDVFLAPAARALATRIQPFQKAR